MMSPSARLSFLFANLGHFYIHLFTAFYAVVILQLEKEWTVSYEDLLGLWTVGSLLVGVAFGAGWSPCIGPVLASILLYTSLEATMAQGTLLLATYAVGLGLPFVVAAVAFSWFIARGERVRRWLVPLERAAGGLLVVIGLLMVTGSFAKLTAFLAGLGQLVTLEMP